MDLGVPGLLTGAKMCRMRWIRCVGCGVVAAVAVVFLPGCGGVGPKPQSLMPTPQIYQKGGVDPFAGLPAHRRTTVMPVHYATNRNWSGRYFGSRENRDLTYGTAGVAIGDEKAGWSQVAEASVSGDRSEPLPLRLMGYSDGRYAEVAEDPERWLKEVDRSARGTRSRDVVIYVHGAKVEFFHSCAFAAELAHFTGREITPVAFDWPTHPEIVAYVLGIDVSHGIHSAARLAELVRRVADGTSARRIHLISWSAGARVLSRGMVELAGDDPEGARKRYRIGSAVFAASDVPEKDFMERLPAIHGLSERVIVYQSDADGALTWSSRLMGGGRRLGLEAGALEPEEIRMLEGHPRLQVIDCSMEKEKRGFDITGHRYWYQHPWVSSDLMLTLRSSARPMERGLTAAETDGVYYFAADYGERIGGVARKLAR